MRVLIQWTKANPEDWLEVDIRPTGAFRRAWERLAAKAEPVGGETIDDNPGWIFGLCVQGVVFAGADHYAAEILADGAIRLILWNDDPEDWPPGTRWADVWEFRDGWVDRRIDFPDGSWLRHQGPDQRRTIYTELGGPYAGASLECGGFIVPVRAWSDFTPPSTALTRHGIAVSDELAARHLARATPRGWEEWTPRSGG